MFTVNTVGEITGYNVRDYIAGFLDARLPAIRLAAMAQ
jgi:hypothetical protein